MNSQLAIVGYGEHARVLQAAALASGMNVVAATSLDCSVGQETGFPLVSDEELTKRWKPHEIKLILGLGLIRADCQDGHRKQIVERFKRLGYEFVGVRHPFSWVSAETKIADSAQIFAGAIVQPGATVGDFSILNTKASIDHDCTVGNFCHIAPGVTLSGSVVVQDFSHVGTGASIINGVHIGSAVTIGAGATVIRDVPDGQTVVGTPARPI